MRYPFIKATQANHIDKGQLQLEVRSAEDNRPIEGATVDISYTGDPDQTLERISTNNSGRSEIISLNAPPLEYSMQPNQNQPYAEYTFHIEAEGFEPKNISGSEILPGVLSVQPARLRRRTSADDTNFQRIVIPAHTLYGQYPPKIRESEIKPISESGEIVLSKVVIPEYIIVHDGPIQDNTASDYYERYRNYIKNVACSEIYATWPEDTIRANVLAIMSFTLNRVYTEWYRNQQ